MTVEELKQEAKQLGYKIIKIPEKIKKSNCICDANSRNVQLWYTFNGMCQYRCKKCGREGNAGKSKRIAVQSWNYAVKNNKFVEEVR